MNRRDALRLLATGAAFPLMPRPLLGALREARTLVGGPSAESPAAPRTLSAHQDATVKVMAELILPRTDTPGATDAGASEFIDLILTEWCSDEARSSFLKGLADVDTRTQEFFGKDLVDCSPAQQAEILAVLGAKMLKETDAPRPQARPRRDSVGAHDSFYSMLRRLTLTAYYTSEAGATAELHFEVIPDRYDGCAAVETHKGPESQ